MAHVEGPGREKLLIATTGNCRHVCRTANFGNLTLSSRCICNWNPTAVWSLYSNFEIPQSSIPNPHSPLPCHKSYATQRLIVSSFLLPLINRKLKQLSAQGNMAKRSTGMSNSTATWATRNIRHTKYKWQKKILATTATSRGWHRSVAFRMKLITFGTFHWANTFFFPGSFEWPSAAVVSFSVPKWKIVVRINYAPNAAATPKKNKKKSREKNKIREVKLQETRPTAIRSRGTNHHWSASNARRALRNSFIYPVAHPSISSSTQLLFVHRKKSGLIRLQSQLNILIFLKY